MSFVAILVALLLERFFDCSHLRNWSWYAKFKNLVAEKLPGQSPFLVLAACVLPIFIVVGLIKLIIAQIFFGFLILALRVAVLLYCFGPRNLWADTYACIGALSEKDATDTEQKLKNTFGITDLSNPQTLQQGLLKSIFMQANYRVFAIVFWYSILGMVGVVLYRLTVQLIPAPGQEDNHPRLSEAARKAEAYLNWPSVRFFTLLFALGGNFNRVFSVWRSNVLLDVGTNDFILTECGMAALNSTNQEKIAEDGAAEKEALNMLDRSFGIMLVVIWVLVFVIP